MKNKLSDLKDEKIKEVLENSNSFRECLIKFGYKSTNGSGCYKIVRNICERRNIDIPKYVYIGNVDGFNIKRKTDDEVFCQNSTYSRHSLKKRILKNNLIEYKCNECGIKNEWNGKLLSLQLEHKNGVNNDNRIKNLIFLCPNCHSQTETFGGKSNKKQYFCSCGNKKYKTAKMCKVCKGIKQRKIERPDKNILLEEIKELGYTGTGKKYGVSDNSIRKWLKL